MKYGRLSEREKENKEDYRFAKAVKTLTRILEIPARALQILSQYEVL